MKNAPLAIGLIVPVALIASACAGLSSLMRYDTPAVASAVGAVNADVVKLAVDTAKANTDRTVNPPAIPGDLVMLSVDGTQLATDKAALIAAISAAKAAGSAVTPAATRAAV